MKISRPVPNMQLKQLQLKSKTNSEQPQEQIDNKSPSGQVCKNFIPSSEVLSKLESMNSENEKQGEDMALDPVTGQYIPADEWAKKYKDKNIVLEVQVVVANNNGLAQIEIRYMSPEEYLKEFGNVANPPKATIHSQGAQKPTDDVIDKLSNSENEKQGEDMALDPVTGQYIPAEEWAKKYNDKTILEVQVVVKNDNGLAQIETRYMSATDYLKEFGNVANPPKATIHSQSMQKKIE